MKHEKYSEAARIKAMADELERRERSRIDEERLETFSQREIKFRSHQRSELEALLGRFNSRRDEHVKQRDTDLRRLLQRNKNVLAIIDGRHTNEEREAKQLIRVSLIGKNIKKGSSSSDASVSSRSLAAQAVTTTNLFSPPIKATIPRKPTR